MVNPPEPRFLGQTSALPASPEEAILDYVPNPRAGELFTVRFVAAEFTSLCPVTAQPDFVNAAAEQMCNVSRSAMVGRVVYDVIDMVRSYRQRMSDAATSALFAHRAEISVGGRKTIFVDMQMVPYGQNGHRILALIPAQSDTELMGGAIGRSGRAAGGAASMDDLRAVDTASGGLIDITVGSALDLFGGDQLRYEDLVAWNRRIA